MNCIIAAAMPKNNYLNNSQVQVNLSGPWLDIDIHAEYIFLMLTQEEKEHIPTTMQDIIKDNHGYGLIGDISGLNVELGE